MARCSYDFKWLLHRWWFRSSLMVVSISFFSRNVLTFAVCDRSFWSLDHGIANVNNRLSRPSDTDAIVQTTAWNVVIFFFSHMTITMILPRLVDLVVCLLESLQMLTWLISENVSMFKRVVMVTNVITGIVAVMRTTRYRWVDFSNNEHVLSIIETLCVEQRSHQHSKTFFLHNALLVER